MIVKLMIFNEETIIYNKSLLKAGIAMEIKQLRTFVTIEKAASFIENAKALGNILPTDTIL